MNKKNVVIVSPATAKANNGNWHTADRWSRFLAGRHRVMLLREWDGTECDAMIALHARRSAASIAAFSAAFPGRPCIVVLTGTDLYRDIRDDAEAQRSLQLASRLVVLQEAGLQELAPALRSKASVIHQSAPALLADLGENSATGIKVIMVGHLREEKDPATFMRAAALVKSAHVEFIHIGAALDPLLGEQAVATGRMLPRYRWLGPLHHEAARAHVMRSRLMVIASRMEGGANVIIEAITSGVPVLASDISGNRGMLGDDYAGYFPVGDSEALARAIDKAVTEPAFFARLQRQCAQRAPLFLPDREQAAVLQLIDNWIP